MNKKEVFRIELNNIKNERIKRSAEKFIEMLPDYFFTTAAFVVRVDAESSTLATSIRIDLIFIGIYFNYLISYWLCMKRAKIIK